MIRRTLVLIALLIAVLRLPAAPNEIIYQTSFEPPALTAGLPLHGQDGWLGGWFLPGTEHPTSISTVNAQSGAQAVRFYGADAQGSIVGSAYALWPLFDLGDPNPPPTPMIVELQADVRLDGPQTGMLGTPEQDYISANLFAVVRQNDQHPMGNFDIGGFFVSSAGKIWAYHWITGNPRPIYGASVPYVPGTYHTLMLRVNFVLRTLTYFVDGVELGSAPFPVAIKSDQLLSGYLSLYGGTQIIETPELSYNRANYNAYFDNYSIAAVPLTTNDVAIQFAATDYAGDETDDDAPVNILRRGYTNSAVSAMFRVANGTATSGRDYRPLSTPVSFAAGQTSRTIKVVLKDDRDVEADERVNLMLSAPSAGSLTRSNATLWLLDDERAGSVDRRFQLRQDSLGFSNLWEVSSIALKDGDDGGVYAALFGEDVSHNYIGVLARFSEDGSRTHDFQPYPLPYGAGPSQIIALENGKRLLVNLVDRLVLLDSKGREDALFSVVAAGDPDIDPAGYIAAVLIQPGGEIIIAGFFNSVNGVARRNLARLLPDGAVDMSFDPGDSTDDFIIDAALQTNGQLLIGGYFRHFAGQPRTALARLNADGTLDPSFNSGTGFGGEFPYVQTIDVQRDGKILVGGYFDTYEDASSVGVARLQADGALDPSFTIGTGFESGFAPGAPGYISRVVEQPDGKVLVSGGFGFLNGSWQTGIVRLNSNGAIDSSFRLGGADAVPASLNGGAAITLLPSGDILVPLFSNVSFLRNDPIGYKSIVRLRGESDGHH